MVLPGRTGPETRDTPTEDVVADGFRSRPALRSAVGVALAAGAVGRLRHGARGQLWDAGAETKDQRPKGVGCARKYEALPSPDIILRHPRGSFWHLRALGRAAEQSQHLR